MEMDFDFIDPAISENNQSVPLPTNEEKEIEGKDQKKKCTLIFNLLLTPLVIYLSFSTWLFEPEKDGIANISMFPWARLPWHNLFRYTELVVGLFIALTIWFLIPFTIQLIWNRLITNIFRIRKLTYAEAYTLYLGIVVLHF